MVERTIKLVWFLCLVITVRGEKVVLDSPPRRPIRLPLNENHRNHTYSASTKAPMATALNPSAPFRRALAVLTRHFKNESDRAYKLLKKPQHLFVEERVHACNLPDEFSHIASVNRSTSQYGWGVMGPPCTTQLESDLDEAVVDSMHVYLAELKKVMQVVVRNAGFDWAKKATTFMEFRKERPGDLENCELLHFTAFRKDGIWRINTGITNENIRIYKEEWHRHYVVEILYLRNNSVTPTLFTLPERWIYNQPPPTKWVQGSTTLLATWGGAPATSLFRHIMHPEDNPAVVAAEKVEHKTKEQVEDATTKSNMMILFFPIALALIPLGLITEASTAMTLGYTVVTDIMSVLPLGIKGKELMDYGRRRQIATRTWVYGGHTKTDLSAAETWHATCSADGRIVQQGRLFIGLAVGFMLLGMVLELFFKYGWRKERIIHKDRKQLWESSICASCPCGERLLGQRLQFGPEKNGDDIGFV